MCVDLKSPLIDLEADSNATGRKLEKSLQRERLSEENYVYCVYWIRLESHTNTYTEGYIGITINLKERIRSHKKNKKTTHFFYATKKYGWNNLIVEVLHDNLTLQDALSTENTYRPQGNIGWNSQRGGELGVESSWYDNVENRQKHKEATSLATRKALSVKDNKKARSERAKQNWINNKTSYEGIVKGSKNPKAILNESQVWEIKYVLLPSGLHPKEIANLFCVKPHVINFIKYGKNWSHI